MNPTAATVQAVVLAILLIPLALVAPLLGTSVALIVFTVGLCLWAIYVIQSHEARGREARGEQHPTLPAAPAKPPDGEFDDDGEQRRWEWRNSSDLKVFRSIVIATAAPSVVGVVLFAFGGAPLSRVPHEERLWLVFLPAALLATLIYVPTLIDWYYVLPRLSGVVRLPPCRSGSDRSWITTTRAWLASRWLSLMLGPIVSGTALVGATMYYFLAFTNVELKDQITVSANSFGATLLIAGIGVAVSFKLLDRLNDVLNPIKVVGKLVRYRNTLHYVVDVSVQGTKINKVTTAAQYGGEPFPNHKGQLVDPKDLTVEEQELPFGGCDKVCCGVNWYCDNNWRTGRYK
jgi:hypothetical protein